MLNSRRPEAMNEQATSVGFDARRQVAVVGGVALGRAERARVVAGGVVLGGLVDRQAQVGDHAGCGLVGDVDDPRGADRVAAARRAQRARRVLVELEHVGVARAR